MCLSGPVDLQFTAAREGFSSPIGSILSRQWMSATRNLSLLAAHSLVKGRRSGNTLLSRHSDVDRFLRRDEVVEAHGILGDAS
jgi:hypothetical protein